MMLEADVIRIERSNPSVSIPIATLQDGRLSFRARGVLVFLLSQPSVEVSTADLWAFSPEGMGEGRDKIREALNELKEAGYLTQTRESRPDERGVKKWFTISTVSDTRIDSRALTPDTEYSGGSGNSPEPWTSRASTNQLLVTSTGSPISHPSDERLTGVTARRESRLSRRERALLEQREQDAQDPSKFIDPDEHEDPDPVDIEARREEITRRRRTRSVGPAENLARSFESQAVETKVPGPFNRAALASQIASWRRSGVSDDVIRTMIEIYWSPGFRRSESVPAWQDFLAQRGALTDQGSRAAEIIEQDSRPDTYWA
jgi:hypothetical protein